MATDGQIIVAAARWAEESFYLKEFVTKQEFPAVIKIIKGQYGGLGVPTLPNPGLQSTALLVSAGRRNKIVAQAIKLKEGRRLMGIGPRIAIPDTYPGYFEILSEEGRAVRCMESVVELSKRRPEGGCLVREPIRGIMAKVDSSGALCPEGARIVALGEMLLPSSEVQLPGYKNRFLQCLDSRGDIVLLGLEQRGKFSALAKEDNISGVHTAKNLLNKRMPLTVRLVHGPPPRGLKSSGHFVPEMRLLTTFQEEHLFALPLQKDTGAVVALPLAAPLKLQTTRNTEQVHSLKELQRLVDKCRRLVAEVADRAYVLDGKVGDPKLLRAGQPPPKTGYFLRRSSSSDSPTRLNAQFYANENRVPCLDPDEYDEIDQIYDYVRGFAPLPKNVRSPFAEPVSPGVEQRSCSSSRSCDERTKPEPPPIETIPGKKLQSAATKAEKRTRREVNEPAPPPEKNPPASIFVKNANTQRGRILRQKSSSPMKERSPPLTKKGSPVFSLRYKSLSNLHQAMELDGTLDSSHSGGRTSGDSGAKLPEKRSRRLSRPLSLTNLVWELRRDPCPPLPQIQHRKNVPSQKLTFGHQTKRIGTLYL